MMPRKFITTAMASSPTIQIAATQAGSPVIYQAGASSRGRQFAAEHAEAIFTAAPTKEILKEVVGDIRRRMVEVGRDPYDARIYTLMTAIVDETREKAWAKHDEFERYGSDEGALVLFSGWMGIDLSEYERDGTWRVPRAGLLDEAAVRAALSRAC